MNRTSKSFPSVRPNVIIEWRLRVNSPVLQCRALAERWLQEDEYTNYRYNVETCTDGCQVYLLRPTWLNKGFDFQVNLEGFRSTIKKARKNMAERPSHADILSDVQAKISGSPRIIEDLYSAIAAVFNCEEPDDVIGRFAVLRTVGEGLTIDKLLKILKWLFVEQDLTYWLHTGRNKLMHKLENDVFGLTLPSHH